MTAEPLRLAQDFLQEAVARSRARAAAGMALEAPAAGGAAATRRCGLGERAAVELDLSERGRELFARLWPEGLEPADLERVQGVLRAWIVRQDALDRRRNHFLRDFRTAHGFDRRAYSAGEARAFDEGLAAVNAEVSRGLEAAARELLGKVGHLR